MKKMFESFSEKVAFCIAMAAFSIGFIIIWFGTNEKLLKISTCPKTIEYSSLGLGAVLMFGSVWIIFKYIKEPCKNSLN